jgi:3D (Asp-Asp-Asp) domain-containing protein
MINFIMGCVFVTATVYNAVQEQTNDHPLITASNKQININDPGGHRWIAVSRDLEKLGFKFGVKVCIEKAGKMNGIWTVQDRMNKRYNKHIDFLVSNSIISGKWYNVQISINR